MLATAVCDDEPGLDKLVNDERFKVDKAVAAEVPLAELVLNEATPLLTAVSVGTAKLTTTVSAAEAAPDEADEVLLPLRDVVVTEPPSLLLWELEEIEAWRLLPVTSEAELSAVPTLCSASALDEVLKMLLEETVVRVLPSVVEVGASVLIIVEDDGLPVAKNCRHFNFASGVAVGLGK